MWSWAAFLAAVGFLAAGCASDPSPPEEAASFQLEPCQIKGMTETARCGTYEVWEDREAKSGRKIGLKVVVLPATGPEPAPDPIVYFGGGPGEAATDNAAGFAAFSPELRKTRDIVLVDVRGTGGSNPLLCSYQEEGARQLGLLEEFLPLEGVERCREELEAKADLTLYTTPLLVDDVHEVVTALGYGKVNLMGGSYGTRACEVYMRRHPDGVRTAVLGGVLPLDARMPMTIASDAQAALDGLFEECAEEASCQQAFPDLRGDLQAVLAQIEAGPVAATVPDPHTGEPTERTLSRAVVVQTLRYMLYSSGTAQEVPLAIHSAAQGDYSIFGRNAALYGGALEALPDGLYLSITCPEDVVRIDDAAVAAADAGTFLGDYRSRQQRNACAVWPKGKLPEGYWEPVRTDVPVLLTTGERDPVTPPRWLREVARTMPNSRSMVIPDGGHSFNGLEGTDCYDDIETRFILQGSFEGIDLGACIDSMKRPPFPTEPPAPGIELSAEQLARYPGTYESTEPPLLVTVHLEDGVLKVDTPFRNGLRLVATSETRFRIVGAPPGYELVAEFEGDHVAVLRLLQPGTDPVAMARQEE
jgi:pimeloyl-ACP methyl ester carboxylesterase